MSHGINLIVTVVEIKVLVERKRLDGSVLATAEVLVGDSTGCVIFSAKNGPFKYSDSLRLCRIRSWLLYFDCWLKLWMTDQVGLCQLGATLSLTNAKIVMFRQHMRLCVDSWGLVEPGTVGAAALGAVDTSHCISDDEFQLVPAAQLLTVPDQRFDSTLAMS
jgi:hypothetical protein